MKKIRQVFTIQILFAVSLYIGQMGCGSPGTPASSSGTTRTGGVGDGDLTLTTTVRAPTSVSVSLSQSVDSGVNTSKSVSKGISASKGEEIKVTKVAMAESAVNNAACTCMKPDGTALASGRSNAAGIVEVKVNSSDVDLTSGVVWDCAIGGMNLKSLCSSASAVSGGSVSCDAVSSSSTVALVNVLKAAGVESVGADFFAKVASGEIKPRAVFKSIASQLDGSVSAGDSSMAGMMKAMKEAMSSCFASGGSACAKPEQFIGGLIDGDSGFVNAAKGFVSGIEFGNAKALCGTGVATMAKTLSDSSFLSSGHSKYGDDFFSNQGSFFGNFGTTEVSGKPEILRGYMEQNFGSASAFQQAMTNAGSARAVGVMATKFEAATFIGKYDVMSKLIGSSVGSLGSNLTDYTKFQKIAEGFGRQVEAVTSAAERAIVIAEPGAFTGRIFASPDAYIGSAGAARFDNQFIQYAQVGSSTFGQMAGCSADVDCGSGKKCNTIGGFCVDACTSGCGMGSPCTGNSNCQSNYCNNGFCFMNQTLVDAAGGDVYSIQMKGPGGSCSFTYQCYPPLTCSGGVCSGYSNWDGIAAAAGLQQASAGDGQAVLNWTTVLNATGYKIYQSTSATGPYELITTLLLGNLATYTITGLTNGTTYYFKISSYSSMGESSLSSPISAMPMAGATGFGATAGNAQAVLNWSAVTGATGYKVYQSLSSGGTYTLVATVGAVTTATITGLTNGTQYFFKVAPVVSSVEGQLTSAVSATPVVPINVYAATQGGLSISTDGGASFANKTTANGLGNNVVRGVFVSGSNVYVATTIGGLSISTDGGTSFANKTTANGLGDNNVYGVFVSGSNVYAATFGGLSISTNGGTSFTNKTTANGLGNNTVRGVFVSGSNVYAATDGGLSISTDGGASFANKTTTNGLGGNNVYGVFVSGSNVYAATFGGLSISTDGGANFTNKTTANGLGDNTVNGVFVSGSNVYAATSGGLSISTDGGTSFANKTTANGLGNNAVRGVFVSGSNVYAATGGGLSISTNGGANFTNKTTANGLGNSWVSGVYIIAP